MQSTLSENKKWTYADYLILEDDNRYEITGGKLLMVPAPDVNHQHISCKLTEFLINFVNRNHSGYIFNAPIDLILNDENVVQPDILFISKQNQSIIKKKGIFGPPDLVIEILSPSSQYHDTYEKKDLYEKLKVKEYWLVNHYMKSIEILVLNDHCVYELFSEGILENDENAIVKSKVLNGMEVKLALIFDEQFE